MATPVTIVASGGLPISETPKGTPMTPTQGTDPKAMPVTIVASGGLPVVLVNNDLTPYVP